MAVEITSREELEAWLEGKPPEWAQVIALRCALRVLPIALEPRYWKGGSFDLRLTQSILRTMAVSSAVGRIPADDTMRRASSSAGAYADAHADATSAADAAYAASAASAGSASVAATVAASAASAAASASAVFAADRGDVWGSVQRDCQLLEEDMPLERLHQSTLWFETPVWWDESWDAVRKRLSMPDHGNDIWREWYFGRIKGLPHAFADFDDEADADFYRWIIEQEDDWWSREPAEVNREIAAFVDGLRLESQSKSVGTNAAGRVQSNADLDLGLISKRLSALEASTEILSAEDVADLKSAVQDAQKAMQRAREDEDRPLIGHNSSAFENVGPMEELVIPVDAVRKIEEQMTGIEAHVLALQNELDQPQPTKGAIATQGKSLAQRLEEIREISPEFFKGFESQLGKGLALSISAGLGLLFVHLLGLLKIILAALGG